MREFAAAGPAALLENGARIAPLAWLSWEVSGKCEKPLLHLRSENHNLIRRVLAITDHSEQRRALAGECFGRVKPDRLEFLQIEFDRSTRELCARRTRGALAERPIRGPAAINCNAHAFCQRQIPPQPFVGSEQELVETQ